MKKRSKKCTTFLITQRTYTVMSADKILVLDKGKPVAQGTHQKLLEKEGFYHHLYMSQFGFDASPSTF